MADLVASWVWKGTWQAAVLVALVLALRLAMGRRLSPGWRCALWAVVGVRLLLPGLALFSVPGWHGQAMVSSARIEPSDGTARVVVTKWWDAEPASSVALSTATEDTNWGLVVLAIWFAGAGLVFLRLVACNARLALAVRRMNAVTDPGVLSLVETCRGEMGVTRTVRVVESDRVRSPAVCGVWHPTLILPAATASIAPEDLRLVLLHEMAHVRRRDVLVEWLTGVVRALHWFNPAVWLATAAFRADRELACDESVLRRVTGPERRAYGGCLLRVLELVGGMPAHPAAIGVFGRKRTLRRRIDLIATYPTAGGRPALWSATGLAAFLAIGCAAVTGARSDPAAREAAAPATEPKPIPAVADAKQAPTAVPEVQNQEDEHPVSKTDLEVRQKLENRLPDVRFDSTAFTDVVDFFRDVTGLNVFVNWRALEAAGIAKNTPVTTRLRDVRAGKALATILRDVAGGQDKVIYVVDDGVITVSTAQDLAQNTVTRVYDLRDLLVDIPDFVGPSDARTSPQTQPARRTSADRAAEIINLLKTVVAPDTWRDAGGTVGSLRELSGQLIVSQTPENQKAVASILGQLRESRGIQVTVESRMLTVDSDQIPEKVRERLRPMFDAGKDEHVAKSFLTQAEVNDLLHEVMNGHGATLLTAPRIILFNGQRAKVEVLNTQRFTTGYNVVRKDGSGETRYEPVIEAVDAGVTFDVQATASVDRKYCTVTMRPKLRTVDPGQPEKVAAADNLLVSHPVVREQGVNTTVSVPDGQTAVIRTAPISPDKKDVLFLLVRPTLIVQRQDAEPRFPIVPAK